MMMTAAQRPYRVLLADDHTLVRSGLRALLSKHVGIEVCAEAGTGGEAVEQVKKGKPDLVILDLTMPDMDGLVAARAIQEHSPDTSILILTMHFSKEIAREVLRSGARGYLLKSDAETDLLGAIEQIRRGQPVIAGQLAITMMESFVNGDDLESQDHPIPGAPLTVREVEIVQLLAEGKSNKEVASTLGVSTRTIESHRNHIMHKMNFASFSELVRFALRSKLIEP
jgi:DNA-binding NarL/FixJ family response regulator